MYGQRLSRIDKGAGDFATAADVEAEQAILGVIRAARADDAVLGEEGGQQGAADAMRQWLVDPLCGTLNYAVGNMLVAVNVALRNWAAAVADPFSNEVFAAVVTTAIVVAVSLSVRLLEGQDVAFVIGYDLVGHVALMAGAIALGDTVRGRRAERQQRSQIVELTAQQYAQAAERRVQAERLAVARDLHDSIGHTVAVISLHTDVARKALATDQAATAAALEVIGDTTRRSMRELRRTVALLRTRTEPLAPVASLQRLDDLVATAEAAGIAVTTDVGATGQLPDTVDSAAYRIAQEAVTNTVRHARASELTISARVADGSLRLRIADNGTGEPGPRPQGHGIAGMTERASALGGVLSARRSDRGFEVDASLPLEPAS